MIAEWKRRHGQIYAADVAGVEYIFRAITFKEYDDITKVKDSQADIEEDIAISCVLNVSPDSIRTAKSGVATVLADQILEMSGLGGARHVKERLAHHRDQAQQVNNLMKAFILAAMPAYTEEQLDEYNFEQLAKKVALAEEIIKVNLSAFDVEGDVRLNVIDPEEEEARKQAEAQLHDKKKKPGEARYDDPIRQKLLEALEG